MAEPAAEHYRHGMDRPTRRPRWPMPEDVEDALVEGGLMETYRNRPPYQQNDYIGWITRAKRPETRNKRIQQMLSELKAGNVYMKMSWQSRR